MTPPWLKGIGSEATVYQALTVVDHPSFGRIPSRLRVGPESLSQGSPTRPNLGFHGLIINLNSILYYKFCLNIVRFLEFYSN